MMKSSNKALLLAALGLMVSVPAMSATVDGITTANVVPSLTLNQTSVLAFGTFASAATANVVSINQTNCSVTNNLPHFGGHSCGMFTVSGYENAHYTVSYDNSTVLNGTGPDNGGESMPATIVLNGQPVKQLISGAGTLQFGGSLTVAANQATGPYQGTYSVTANYQ